MYVKCPNCGDDALVTTQKYQVRCLTCLHRFSVDPASWSALPVSRKFHRGHTIWDNISIILCRTHVKPRSWKGFTTILLIVGVPSVAVFIGDAVWSPNYRLWSAHFWIVAMLSGVVLLALLFWLHAKGQVGKNVITHCGVCGYDLRGSGVRCPECGHERDAPVPDPLAKRKSG